jgi:hypothetical protein
VAPTQDIVQLDFEWFEAGVSRYQGTLRSPADVNLAGIRNGTVIITFNGFTEGAAAALDRVDAQATDAAGSRSNRISRTLGAPLITETTAHEVPGTPRAIQVLVSVRPSEPEESPH